MDVSRSTAPQASVCKGFNCLYSSQMWTPNLPNAKQKCYVKDVMQRSCCYFTHSFNEVTYLSKIGRRILGCLVKHLIKWISKNGVCAARIWTPSTQIFSRSRLPCGLKRRSEATCSLESRVRIRRRTWLFVCCVCCVLCRYRPLRRADHSFRGFLSDACVVI
jgi:hypothetical protein